MNRRGFTLVELLVTLTIVGVLAAVAIPGLFAALTAGRTAASTSNLHNLVGANLLYVAENDGYYCPAQDKYNLVRWHGSRAGSGDKFDGGKGYLGPYIGRVGELKVCPLFLNLVSDASSFEQGTGGYGYNATYIGGTPADMYQPIKAVRVLHPERTVMFTTTAFAKTNGLQEYAFCEPYEWVDPNNNLAGDLQPSVHFRASGGKALVGWCDGHVSAELPAKLGGTDYYGGDSEKARIGWFGPHEQNGYWNPDYDPSKP